MDAGVLNTSEGSVLALVEKLASEEEALRQQAEELLLKLDECIIDELAPFVNDPRLAVRHHVTRLVRQKGGLRAGPPLVLALKNEEEAILRHAMEGLAALGHHAVRLLEEKSEELALQDEPAWQENIRRALEHVRDAQHRQQVIIEEHVPQHAPDLIDEHDLGGEVKPGTDYAPPTSLEFLQKPLRKPLSWRPTKMGKLADTGLGKGVVSEKPADLHRDRDVFDEMCDIPDFDVILRELRSVDAHRRNVAIERLHEIGRPAVRPLCAAMEKCIVNERVKRADRTFLMAAMAALEEIHSKNAIRTLRKIADCRGDDQVTDQAHWLVHKLRR